MAIILNSEAEMMRLGNILSSVCDGGQSIWLQGDLGAGKTTLVRGFLRGKNYKGIVKSPTYSLVEEYAFDQLMIAHFDLYRLSDPEELDYIGIRDYINQNTICLIEWPEMGVGILPEADMKLMIQSLDTSRKIVFSAESNKMKSIINIIKSQWV